MSDKPCACRFERREQPDFSGKPTVQTEECSFHAVKRGLLEDKLAAAQAEIAALKGALEATYAKLREVNETGAAVVSECVSEIAALKARKVAYDKANPLGGPAKMFYAMAERIGAGEPWDEVLRDYDVGVGIAALRDKPCPHVRTSGTTNWCELAEREVAALRGMIRYALDGPDDAIRSILMDALNGKYGDGAARKG